MDYEPANQSVNPPVNPPMIPPMESMEQSSSMAMWYVVGGIAVIAALGLWYYSTLMPVADMSSQTMNEQTPVTNPAQTPSSGNSVADISADLNQIPDISAELNQAAAISAQEVQGF